MSDKLTPWYPPHIKPVRVGVYETTYDGYRSWGYSYWNPGFGLWGPQRSTAKEAANFCEMFGVTQRKGWRGLAHPPQSHNSPASCEKK